MLKTFLTVINAKVFLISFLSVVTTYLCIRYDLHADYPLTLVATAVVFPIVFTIDGAYKRREQALMQYGLLKANGRAIYFAIRDWFEERDEDMENEARELLGNLLFSCRKLLMDPIENLRQNEDETYKNFSTMSKFVWSGMRRRGLERIPTERCSQYLVKMHESFEELKHIYQYRTPRELHIFSNFFISILPLVYGPYFAHVSQTYSEGLTYVMPVLFSAILVGLDNIQNDLENPFDQIGQDDIYINVELFIERLSDRGV